MKTQSHNIPYEKKQETGPFFSASHKAGSKDTIRRKPDATWVKDKDGDLFFDTEKKAQARKKKLEKKGEWSEFKIESFQKKGDTFWRVLMRGPKSSAKKPADESTKKDKADTKENSQKETPASGGTDPVFALTFDDGPHTAELHAKKNLTEKVLDVLKQEGIKGAFFIQTGVDYRGDNKIGRELVKRMSDEGHVVGVHTGGTIDHELHTTAEKKGTLKNELESGKKYIHDETGKDATFVRPPTGAFNKDVSKTYTDVGLKNLLWDIDGDQGKNLDIGVLESRLDAGLGEAQTHGWKPWVQKASSKIVILYHDIQKGTANNIAELIKYIRDSVKKLGGGTARFGKP